jgi:hypothetical protein
MNRKCVPAFRPSAANLNLGLLEAHILARSHDDAYRQLVACNSFHFSGVMSVTKNAKVRRARRASALQDKLILLSAGMEPAHDRKHDRGH